MIAGCAIDVIIESGMMMEKYGLCNITTAVGGRD